MDRTGDFQWMGPAEFSKGKVPWALQPDEMFACSDTDEEDLQKVRNPWLQLIEDRIALYDTDPTKPRTPSSPPTVETRADPYDNSARDRVFGIVELLEKILRHARNPTRLIALSVCHRWRDVALRVMRPSSVVHDFAHAYPCPPVKFGDLIPRQLNWLPATEEELEYVELENELNMPFDRDGIYRGMLRFKEAHRPNIIKTVCYPARVAMATNAPENIYGTKFFYTDQLMYNDIKVGWSSHEQKFNLPKWVDVTQFNLNPYFEELFQDSFEVINGLFEIVLRPSCSDDSGPTWDSLPPAAMSYLATQFLTQPPVMSLNVSTWIPMMNKPRPRKALHIVNVKNDDGIRVPELLAAMKAASDLATEHWKYWARLLHTAVKNEHPGQDFWVVDGRPKLLISLDPFVSGDSFKVEERNSSLMYYLTCMHAVPDKEKRQEEWISKEMWSSE